MTDQSVSHYRVLHPLGAGGMGEVYAAFDETLKRRVALKAIRPDQRLDGESKARFLREARILSQLDHPNICRVYDYVEQEDGDWLVLELIDGRSLSAALGQGIDRPMGLRIAEQLATVLKVTHEAGVVHRDLKPSNVMLTASGEVKVLDFGLARSAFVPGPIAAGAWPATAPPSVDPATPLEVTRSAPAGALHDGSEFQSVLGGITGTLAYMSPEQARGEAATPASDIYSLGVMLQEIFTGQSAYEQGLDYVQLLGKVQRGETLPADRASSHLSTLITRLKSPTAAQRPAAIDVVERLQWIRHLPARRLRRATAAGIAVMLLLGGIKYTVDLARERSAAVSARQDADRRRDQAEALIGFMLGDLREKLRQVGRLDLLQDVGAKATSYFDSVPPESLTREELFRRSQAMHQIGQIQQQRGDLSSAMTAYRASLDLAARVAAKDPANSAWQLGLATAHFYVGDGLRLQGDLDGAMREFSAYRDVASALVARDPGNPQWQLEFSYGLSNVAAALEAKGNLGDAARELERSLAIKEQLARRDPANREWQYALATGHNRLGVVLDKAGNGDRALHHYSLDLDIRRQLVERYPRDNSLKRSMVTALLFVGNAHEDRGNIDAALAHYRAALDGGSELVAVDPANANWRRDVAVAEYWTGGLQRVMGQLAAAESHCRTAFDIFKPIADGAPTHIARQRDLASATLCLGLTRLDRGDVRGAEDAAGIVGRLADVIGDKDRDSQPVVSQGRLFAARLAERRGNVRDARRLREDALRVVSSASAADKRWLATQARALIALGRLDEARPLVEKLTASGYRHPLLVRDWDAASRTRSSLNRGANAATKGK